MLAVDQLVEDPTVVHSVHVAECMRMTGLKEVAGAIDDNETLAEAKSRTEVVMARQTGYVPRFLN